MKNGSQQAMKPPITILSVWAVLVSRRNDDTLEAGSKFNMEASKLRDSGLVRRGMEDLYKLAVLDGVIGSGMWLNW